MDSINFRLEGRLSLSEDVGRDVLRRLAELRVRTRPVGHQLSKDQHRLLVATHVELATVGAHRISVDVVDGRGQ